MISINELTAALMASWVVDTAYDAADWSPENPARGQCVVLALVAQDIEPFRWLIGIGKPG